MAENIEREAVLDYIRYKVCQGEGNIEHRCQRGSCAYCGICEIMCDISSMPAADVQPVEKWCEYGFEYREPAEYGYYLTYYHGRIHVSEWSVSGWYNETGLPIDDDVVEYWQPLPEPPKK